MSYDDFTITRVFNAPRQLVWDAHIKEEHLKHWWGPEGAEVTVCSIDLRIGGVFHYGLKMPGGFQIWGRWIFREIEAPAKLVVLTSFADAQGDIAQNPWSADWPKEMLSTFTFDEEPGGKTRLTVRWAPHEATPAGHKVFQEGKDSMQMGWTGTLDRLTSYLPQAK